MLLEELQQRHVMVLVTSRKAVGVSLGMAEPLRLGPLPAESGVQLLTGSAGSRTAWEADDAMDLVAICGYNALAILVLAGLIKNQYCVPRVSACTSYSSCPVY